MISKAELIKALREVAAGPVTYLPPSTQKSSQPSVGIERQFPLDSKETEQGLAYLVDTVRTPEFSPLTSAQVSYNAPYREERVVLNASSTPALLLRKGVFRKSPRRTPKAEWIKDLYDQEVLASEVEITNELAISTPGLLLDDLTEAEVPAGKNAGDQLYLTCPSY